MPGTSTQPGGVGHACGERAVLCIQTPKILSRCHCVASRANARLCIADAFVRPSFLVGAAAAVGRGQMHAFMRTNNVDRPPSEGGEKSGRNTSAHTQQRLTLVLQVNTTNTQTWRPAQVAHFLLLAELYKRDSESLLRFVVQYKLYYIEGRNRKLSFYVVIAASFDFNPFALMLILQGGKDAMASICSAEPVPVKRTQK